MIQFISRDSIGLVQLDQQLYDFSLEKRPFVSVYISYLVTFCFDFQKAIYLFKKKTFV
jgi:hypothetical protein